MKAMMMSCKEVVKTISKEDHLNWRRRIEIRLHLMMCHHCGKYAKQLARLKMVFKRLVTLNQAQANPEGIKLLEERIVKSIKNGD